MYGGPTGISLLLFSPFHALWIPATMCLFGEQGNLPPSFGSTTDMNFSGGKEPPSIGMVLNHTFKVIKARSYNLNSFIKYSDIITQLL